MRLCLPALGAAGAKAFAAEDGPPRLRFERNTVGLSTLIAGNLKSFAFAASLSRTATEVSASCIATGLTTFGMAETAFPIVILFAFGKWKGRSALGAGNL
jgi:hypothetical protein